MSEQVSKLWSYRMTWNLPTTRFRTLHPRLLIFGAALVMLVFVHTSALAQPSSTPQATPGDRAALPAPAPDRQPNATGDPNGDKQIGISLNDRDTDADRHLYRVEDPQQILKLEQQIELADDAQRLTNHGLPTIIVLRESTDARDRSQTTADQLRIDRGVESSGGADDGMVMLVSIDPASPRSGSVVLSFGRNALPKGGLTAASVEAIYERVIAPRLERNKLYSALHVGIREIIYFETYIPEARPPLTESERTVREAVNVLGPLALGGSAAGFVVMGRSRSRTGASGNTRSSAFIRTARIVGLGALCLFFAAVVARSTIGVASAALLGLLIWTQFLIDRIPRGPARAGFRTLSLPYRRMYRPVRSSRVIRTTANSSGSRARGET
ncbi:MAG: hypothetical protein M3440_03010, partial [Chloroflexota bacterium]|nr:hypothetical protein [Chloroflexota bacterium]